MSRTSSSIAILRDTETRIEREEIGTKSRNALRIQADWFRKVFVHLAGYSYAVPACKSSNFCLAIRMLILIASGAVIVVEFWNKTAEAYGLLIRSSAQRTMT